MTIAKANILTFVNEVLKRSETDIDTSIQSCLNDLSNYNFLVATDESQSVESGDTTLDYPTDYKEAISITLVNSNDVAGEPLIKLPGGHKDYRQLRENDSATSRPYFYSEYNRKFWLWRPPDGDYDAVIEYYRRHPQDVDNILYVDDFINVINFGSAYYVACKLGLERYITIWGSNYQNEKSIRESFGDIEPYIVR